MKFNDDDDSGFGNRRKFGEALKQRINLEEDERGKEKEDDLGAWGRDQNEPGRRKGFNRNKLITAPNV